MKMKRIKKVKFFRFICLFISIFLCNGSYCFGVPAIKSCADNLYPFLSAYFCSGHMEFIDDNHIKLNLKADSHFCDCGAPDCFGTNIEVHFYLSTIPGKCILKSVQVKLDDYNHCVEGEIDEKIELKPYKLSSGEINLYDPNLFKIEFRNDENQKGIILERRNFTYYSKFPPNAVLRELKKDCEGDNPSPVDIVTQSNGFFELLEKYAFTIQVLATSDQKKAQEYYDKISNYGFDPYIRESYENGVKMFRVRVGRGTKEYSDELKQKIINLFKINDCWVLKGDLYFDF